LGGRKGIGPVKNLSGEVLAWLSVWSEIQRFAYGPADATATHSLAPVNPDWFYFSGANSPG